ncbi:patatin-like phospholipase family protein [Modestobacter sp. VKM Ac-2986]|uniref:patatin-like phospholipase family protein n=1 Tax=Modestobacter sp. VKM Ac-2986 TaxID=3004140 RepID=UPI0022ABC428|nr:patatin-like phospholipase family protein [Modestobacter sp. VKM Ac-2986]MCZ2830666.1 patatin-like phospholipase family protein [Modestobacter sp. VKM Ac-2986]
MSAPSAAGPVRARETRALVLGGGGVAGIAWETGILAGLAAAGVDVVHPDLMVGTSAGSTVAAQVTSSASLADLYQDQVDGTGAPEPTVLDVDLVALMAEVRQILGSGGDPRLVRQRIGAMSLAHDRVPQAERRALIEVRLPSHVWPGQRLAITTIDAETGELVVLTNDSGVDLVDAVAASCAIPRVWPAVTVDGRRLFDGGMRSGTNTDVADGHGRVLVLDVIGLPETSDVARVTAPVFTITPDEASQVGLEDLLDPASRAVCARAGHEQGQRIAADVSAFWS